MANRVAPIGQVFVCSACGKRSKDEYGEQAIDPGWDESCMMHAVLCYSDRKFGPDGAIAYQAVPENVVTLPVVRVERY